jgi:hypothetical protein
MLPRMIDIARAMLPGGNVGEYQIGRGMSGAVFKTLRISTAEFVVAVGAASSDGDIADWLWSREDVPAAALSQRLASLTVADVPDELRQDFQRLYGSNQPSDRRVFDILEADDARAFTKQA